MFARSLWLVAVFLVVAVPAAGQTFVFDLSGSQEVPPNPSTASGGCMGVLDSGASTFTLDCVHDVVGATVTHIHRAPAGANGPAVFDLGDPASPLGATWTAMTPANIADLLAGNLYLNIHTAGRPDGEIRGQILPRTVDTVAFSANGTQVVPPNGTSFTASCSADLNAAATSLAIDCTHNVAAASAAHVHDAPVGFNGPVVFTFGSAASPLSGNMPVTPLLVASFAARFLYLDIHTPPGTEDASGAEIRGQIGLPPVAPVTGTIIIVKKSSPAGGTGFLFTDTITPGGFTLNDGGTRTFSGAAPGTYTVTEGVQAGWSLTDIACNDGDSTGDPFARSATVRLGAGEVVTCTFTNLQSVASPQLFVFHLSGDQEVPGVNSPARGGCFGQFDAVARSFALVCTHNVEGPSVTHIHRAPAGSNGPIAFDLGDPASPMEATWTGMTPADVADLLAGNFYVNIHASGRPGGEIRGQILPRTVDSFSFAADGDQEVPPTESRSTGQCFADLNAPATSLLVRCTHNVLSPTMIHLHDSPAGVEGPIVHMFANASPFEDDVPMTPRLVADFAAGFLYVNLHSPNYEQGEIRGQLTAGAAAPAAIEPIPTLSEWAALLMLLSLLSTALWRARS